MASCSSLDQQLGWLLKGQQNEENQEPLLNDVEAQQGHMDSADGEGMPA